MYCPYCDGPVVGEKQVVIVVGSGPAHSLCHERAMLSQRIFEGVQLPNLSVDKLMELQEMVRVELNSRDAASTEVELFA